MTRLTVTKRLGCAAAALLMSAALARGQVPARGPACGPESWGEAAAPRRWDDPLNGTERPAALAGRVVGRTGVRLALASLWLQRGLATDSTARRTVADSAGVFRFAGVAPGRYVLRVRALGYDEQWHALDLAPAAADSVCVRLRPKRIELAPVSPNGKGSRGRRLTSR